MSDASDDPEREVQTREDPLVSEAARLCKRYVDEVVLRFDLCPWAAPALRAGRVQTVVITKEVASLSDQGPSVATAVARELDKLSERFEMELVLVVLPRFELGRFELDAFLRMVREEHGRRDETFAMAAFHPDASPDRSDPERLIPFLRRSPDPMIQAVRSSVLDKIDSGRSAGTAFVSLDAFDPEALLERSPESLRRRIARQNLETLEREGEVALAGAIEAIIEDRKATYARLRSTSRDQQDPDSKKR